MRRFAALLLPVLLAGPSYAQSSDAVAQYRVAKRLVAEGAPTADEALERVVTLEPDGPLADDALFDRATLIGLPTWPEDLATLSGEQIARAQPILKRIADTMAGADRAPEARLRLGLLQLAPVAGRDTQQARLKLLALAAAEDNRAISSAARYALAWSAEQQGDHGRAEAAYQRLRIESPGTEVCARATAGVGRLRLRQDRPDEAAAALQRALDSGDLDASRVAYVAALRDVAIDAFLRRVTTVEALRVEIGSKPSAVFATPGSGALVAHRRSGFVVEHDAAGTIVDRWDVDQPLDIATTASGARFAVTADAVLRLESGGRSIVHAAPGELGSFSAGVALDDGRVFVLDRKGERAAVIEPGSGQPRTLWRGSGVRLSGLAWDGNRLLSIDTRAKSVLAIYPEGSTETVVSGELERPSAIAADPAGRIAVLDARGSRVAFFTSDGASFGKFDTQFAGMQRTTGVTLGLDGAMQLVEEGSGLWWRAE